VCSAAGSSAGFDSENIGWEQRGEQRDVYTSSTAEHDVQHSHHVWCREFPAGKSITNDLFCVELDVKPYLNQTFWKLFHFCLRLSTLTLLVGQQEGHPACKNIWDYGGGHWLVRMEWHPAGWSVCLPLLIFPCTMKSRSSLLAPAHLGGRGKRAIKRLCVWVCVNK